MQYLNILLQIFQILSSVASAISTAETTLLPTLQSLWADLQAAEAAIVSAFQSNATLSDTQLANINATLTNAHVVLDGITAESKKA